VATEAASTNNSVRSISRSPESARPRAAGLDAVGRAVPGRQLAHGHVQGGGDGAADRLVGPRLDLAGAPQLLDGHRPERVEQHGLADSAQPGEDHAPLRAAAGDSLQHDVELLQLAVATGELGRPLAGTGGVGIAYGVHALGLYEGI
jgi:hypothetical protein